jgi:hypothetical protein
MHVFQDERQAWAAVTDAEGRIEQAVGERAMALLGRTEVYRCVRIGARGEKIPVDGGMSRLAFQQYPLLVAVVTRNDWNNSELFLTVVDDAFLAHLRDTTANPTCPPSETE